MALRKNRTTREEDNKKTTFLYRIVLNNISFSVCLEHAETHNIAYYSIIHEECMIMEEVQTIVALGAGSITKRVFGDGRIERCDNVKDVGLYIEKIEEMIDRKRKLLGME